MQIQSKSTWTEFTFSLASKEDLIRAFRLKDQAKLILPDNFRFPMNVRSYLTWKEPSGVYTYLVFQTPSWDLPRGVAFKKTSTGGEPIGGLCSWCHAYGTSEDIGLMSVNMSPQVSTSYLICQDLRCIEKIAEACTLAGKSPEKPIAELYYKMQKLFENISNYKIE